MRIRQMTVADYSDLLALWESTPGMGLNPYDDSLERIGAFLQRNPESCFVAERDGELVGSALAGHDGRRGYLYHVCVLPHNRGMGIGAALVRAALDALQREGIRKAGLVVFRHNQIGNRFWTRSCWERREDLNYYSHELE